jgi:hypothetical protein
MFQLHFFTKNIGEKVADFYLYVRRKNINVEKWHFALKIAKIVKIGNIDPVANPTTSEFITTPAL